MHLSSRVANLPASPFVTFATLGSQYPDAISFRSGSPGHGLIPGVRSAIDEVRSTDISLYRVPHYGSPKARKDAAQYFQQRYGLEFDRDREINITSGFTHLFYCICTTLLNPGDPVLLIQPTFPQYQQPIELAGARRIIIPTSEAEEWKPKPEVVKATLANYPNAKMIVFNYPNNPSGAVLTQTDWNGIIDVLREEIDRRAIQGEAPLLVLSDDAYVPLFHSPEPQENYTLGKTLSKRLSFARGSEKQSLERLLESLFMACTLSKEGVGGLLLGMGATKNTQLIEYLRITQKATTISSNSLGEIALSAIIQSDPSETLAWARKLYSSRLNQLDIGLEKLFESHGLTQSRDRKSANFMPTAGMYLYRDFSHFKELKITADFLERVRPIAEGKFERDRLFDGDRINTNLDVALWLLVQAGVTAVPIGIPERCYIRFSVSLPQAIVEFDAKKIHRQKTEEKGEELIARALNRIDKSLGEAVS
ncbi:pyridoxal phosphate-dependent aminotransferase [Roseofilum casamattae]|uniref:Pyridoxal phosphate-dependent aminotransferase n=1 Tax=Roseofilum casamattae BLCC-M143 TaxID=3022442 RepID=A0ABT7C356_9CYAN|nr:pyridoxal phosphate-dependent aminotransferase [Roseofilum casamattae]MDJ1185106.1 pyridoxal phosphate-dependent aminotransferase [Roseofilum casamattae BLCC-M143]